MQTQELEVINPDTVIPPESESLTLWDKLRAETLRIKTTAETLTIRGVDDKAGMALARATRLAIRDVRLAIEKKHKELKEPWLEGGRKLDYDKNKLLEIIEPLEERLKKMEQFAIDEGIRIEDERRKARVAEISPFLMGPIAIDLGKISDTDYSNLLQDTKDLHAAKIDRERKAEEERIAALKAEEEERRRIREENERLKQEAIAREAEAEAERARVAAEKAAAEAEAQKEREASAAKLKEQQDAAEAAQRAAEEKALKEREAIEAKAAEERKRAAAEKAEADRKAAVERAKVEAERQQERETAEANAAEQRRTAEETIRKEREAREKLQASQKAREAAEKKKKDEEAAAARKAAAAPDAEKLRAFGQAVMDLLFPKVSDGAKAIAGVVIQKRAEFAAWIARQADAMVSKDACHE